ncbi:oxidoreductase [Vibrio sinaloensis]|uniref:FAD-dependent oxidoreductase n=1 Tax=Photobacterium sp. (strain ATCC 43367) TaxID=379097 RepID=UPI00057F2A61|nr:FAD-dependent oxidoreductase [Vibrio sinaloensis]KIE21482.1 oxidoreductase [Vibrio sinaloensis]
MQSKQLQTSASSVAVIGGGIAGATAALHLSELGIKVTLIEKKPGLVYGPPICHLHAGGNLYREISTQQCLELLKQSVDTARLYPHTINNRPTIIAVPYADGGTPEELYERLLFIQKAYQELVNEDERNKVLGEPEDYYRFYGREELETLANRTQPSEPSSFDDWMIPFAKEADLDSLRFPVVIVQEPGWSVFRIAASATLALEQSENCHLMLDTYVTDLTDDEGWTVHCTDGSGRSVQVKADYLVNACGYETGHIDDLADKPRNRLVEFKAAYVTKWSQSDELWPEVIFHGPRGTPNGMAQLTPYPNGVFQLHGMTKDITLFEDGLVSSDAQSSQPQLPMRLRKKIIEGWNEDVVIERSRRAINHMARLIPKYQSAVEFGTPLFGAQQIPGNDETLRAADVTFAGNDYARLEVVKGSSALEAVTKLVEHWHLYDYRDQSIEELHPISMSLAYEQVEERAKYLASSRDYPEELAEYYGQ